MSEAQENFPVGAEFYHDAHGLVRIIEDFNDGHVLVHTFGETKEEDEDIIVGADELTQPSAEEISESSEQIESTPPAELLAREDIQVIKDEAGKIVKINSFVRDGDKFRLAQMWPGDPSEWTKMPGSTYTVPNTLRDSDSAEDSEDSSKETESAKFSAGWTSMSSILQEIRKNLSALPPKQFVDRSVTHGNGNVKGLKQWLVYGVFCGDEDKVSTWTSQILEKIQGKNAYLKEPMTAAEACLFIDAMLAENEKRVLVAKNKWDKKHDVQPAVEVPEQASLSVNTLAKPQPDLAEIRRSLDVLFEPGDVVELRVFDTPEGTWGGYYNDFDELAKDYFVLGLREDVKNLYWTIQRIDSSLLDRSPNKAASRVKRNAQTRDPNVKSWRWLPLDFDPNRPAKTSSTDARKLEAYELALKVRRFLVERGVQTIFADSGNGYHLLARIDVDVTDERKNIIKKLLSVIADVFETGEAGSDSGVAIDRTVFNPSRILKAYGTVARKGEHTEERPWRLSKILDIPNKMSVVTESALQELSEELKPLRPKKLKKESVVTSSIGPAAPVVRPVNTPTPIAVVSVVGKATIETVPAELARLGIEHGACIEPDGPDDSWKWHIVCPFNSEHRGTDAYVYAFKSGAYGFHCSHNSCDKHLFVGTDATDEEARAALLYAFQEKIGGFKFSEQLPDYYGLTMKAPDPAPSTTTVQTDDAANFTSYFYDPNKKGASRPWRQQGLIRDGGFFVFWLGAMKAKKSLEALRKAMHEACGKDWLYFRNLQGPKNVLFVDAENPSDDIDERYKDIITEFTDEEQTLIRKNLRIFKGQELRERGINIEWSNKKLWDFLTEEAKNCEYIYLDCLYQFHSQPPKDNEGLKKVIDIFMQYFAGKCVYVLHHTRRSTPEELSKGKTPGLKELGPEEWAAKAYGGSVSVKLANLIFCQEKKYKIGDDGSSEGEIIYFQFFGRSTERSVLYHFEQDYESDHLFARKLVNMLTSSAVTALGRLGKHSTGRWDSWREVLNCASSYGRPNGRDHQATKDLKDLGYIIPGVEPGEPAFRIQRQEDIQRAIAVAETSPAAKRKISEWLHALLGTGEGLPLGAIWLAGTKDGFSRESLREVKKRLKVISYKKGGQHWWKMPDESKEEKAA